MAELRATLTTIADRIREADSGCHPFAPFSAWSAMTVDGQRWERLRRSCHDLASANPDQLNKATAALKRAAALETGAIEGLYTLERGITITATTQAAFLESYLRDKDRTRQMVHSQQDSYDRVLDFATSAAPLVEAWIRDLHATMCASQGTYKAYTSQGEIEKALPLGQYKTEPNHVIQQDDTMHAYAPVAETAPEMQRFVAEITSPEFNSAPPQLQAAYAHHAFTTIHPFADGNGRVARALASVFTYRSGSIPLMILVEDRSEYLDALAQADSGNYQPFVSFVDAKCAETFSLFLRCMRIADLQESGALSKQILSLYTTAGGYTHAEVDQATDSLLSAVGERAHKSIDPATGPNLALSTQVGDHAPNVDAAHPAPRGYRRLADHPNRALIITFETSRPAYAKQGALLFPWVPIDADKSTPILIQCDIVEEPLQVAVSEIFPIAKGIAQVKIGLYVEEVLSILLNKMLTQAKKQLDKSGYRGS
jgi:Fic family protein